MHKLELMNLLEFGTFFPNMSQVDILHLVMNHHNDKFGETIKMYYFYEIDFTISFTVDDEKQMLLGEQVEIKQDKQIEMNTLSHVREHYLSAIESTYTDGDELIVFMQNGANVFYKKVRNKYVASKITSKSEVTRALIRENFKKNHLNSTII